MTRNFGRVYQNAKPVIYSFTNLVRNKRVFDMPAKKAKKIILIQKCFIPKTGACLAEMLHLGFLCIFSAIFWSK